MFPLVLGLLTIAGLGIAIALRRAAARNNDSSLPDGLFTLKRRELDSRLPRSGGPISSTQPDRDGTLTRYPSLHVSGTVAARLAIEMQVDLLAVPDSRTRGEPLRIAGLPADWQFIDVRVLLSSAHLSFPEGRNSGVVRVHRAGNSMPCAMRAFVNELPAGTMSIQIDAYFLYDERHCGAASIEVPVTAAGDGAGPSVQSGGFKLDAVGEAPTLKVYIRRVGPGSEGRLFWTLDPSGDRSTLGLPPSLSEESTIGAEPEQYVRTAFAALGDARATSVGGPSHMEELRAIGFRLYRDATPRCFKDVYWALRDRLGGQLSIQFITDEPHIPWELMRPAEDGRGTADLLAVDHPVARWSLGWEGYMAARLPAGTIATVAPDYTLRPTFRRLPAAQLEIEQIHTRFGSAAVSLPAKVDALRSILRNGSKRDVAILHFAGHGKFDTANADQSYIALEDGDVRVGVVNAPEVTLGLRCGTFVIFDACEVGSASGVLGTIGGWATAFLARRFSGFVAPLWSVEDYAAANAMTAFLQHLLNDRWTLGESLRAVRRDFGATSPTYYSYLCFGDVMARVRPRPAAGNGFSP